MNDGRKIHGMQFWKVAKIYYPNLSYSSAVRRFRKELAETSGLHDELKSLGYSERSRYFNSRQVAVIIKWLGDF